MGKLSEFAEFRRDRARQATISEVQNSQIGELVGPRRNLTAEVLTAQIQHTLVRDAVKHPLGQGTAAVALPCCIAPATRCLSARVAHGRLSGLRRRIAGWAEREVGVGVGERGLVLGTARYPRRARG